MMHTTFYNWITLIRWTGKIEFWITLILGLVYAYQVWYIVSGLIGLWKEKKEGKREEVPLHRFAAVISARNESAVIGQLIASLKQQRYPQELFDIYVVADNCTDDTAEVSRKAGAKVFERFDHVLIGKGYALDWFFHQLHQQGMDNEYEGFMVFDADNIVDPNFVPEMNRTYSTGHYDAITSYRNSKNFDSNWISAGYSLWYLRESRFLNYPRQLQKTNCAISGTGFLVSSEIIRENHGWPFHLLTEDIQFSADCASRGRRIGYCDKAMVYDEQPTSFKQSWNQRLRWSKGFYQVDAHYTGSLLRAIFRGGREGFSAYDIFVTVAPAMLLTISLIILNLFLFGICLAAPLWVQRSVLHIITGDLFDLIVRYYFGMIIVGALTLYTERKKINASIPAMIYGLVTFPLFMMTYFPIALCALVQKVEWTPIAHHAVKSSRMPV